ncbi:MAG: amino acid-binding protein [Eubacterium sp.]|nr:amino acid-binding protein [Eubacterium sp.]
MLQQISIFAENKKGTMRTITEILAREQISILGSVTNDSAEYGIVRMVVSDPDKALQALIDHGFICKSADVIGVEIEDEVGHLNKVLVALEDSNVNVNYLYLSFNRENGKPIIVLHAEDAGEVEMCLESRDFKIC